MFPERIDKLILDGVQNPHEYYNELADLEEWTQFDSSFSGIFSTCIKVGASACPLAALNKTAVELETMYWAFLDQLREQPITVPGAVIGYSEVKVYAANLMYNNKSWPAFAALLFSIFSDPSNAATAIAEVFAASSSTASQSTEPGAILAGIAPAQALYGIHCGDRLPRAATLEDFMPTYDRLLNISRVQGDLVAGREMTCAQWPFHARERAPLQQLHGIAVENPVLIIGNDGDAFTPLVSARNISASFPNARVLELKEAYGHCSTSVPSSCAWEQISRYWNEGVLPEEIFTCEVEAKPFTNVTWDDIFAGTGTVDAGDGSGVSDAIRASIGA
jgi:pimeloyl-ACP methyl ester carboxylesterase